MQSFSTNYTPMKRILVTIVRWVILLLFASAFILLLRGNSYGQANINYVEYYLDQDPGVGRGTPVTITPAINVANVPITLDVTTISRGVHILATRARSATGVWSFSHYWYLFKPYLALAPGSISNVVKVEYFIDRDPGLGNGINVPITSATNMADLTFSFPMAGIGIGTHVLGARALTADGSWSLTNFWVFVKPFENINPSSVSNIDRIEYYVNRDPGIGNATPISVTPVATMENINFSLPISTLPSGAQLIGFRARTANGSWSLTNTLLFVKPYTNLAPMARPNITAMEYFLDYDPGIGRGISVPITADTNYTNLSFNVNLAGIVPGTHFVQARTRDAYGNWSMLNSWQFTIPGTPPTLETLINGTTFCAGSSINVGFNIPTQINFNANNKFVAQLSDNSGLFTTPIVLGELSSTAMAGNISCVIPANTVGGSGYRIRVVATSQTIVGSANTANLTINSLPPKPVYTSPLGDTTVCVGNPLTFNVASQSFTPNWLFNGNVIANGATHQFTIPVVTNATAGVYRLRLTNAGTCVTLGDPITVAVNTNSPSVATVSPSGNVGICIGNSQTLTSSITNNIQWHRNGVPIPGATSAAYAVNSSGTYTVVTINTSSGCTLVSSNNTVVSLGAALVAPTVVANGPLDICNNSSVSLTASSAPNYQWFRNNTLISGATSQSYSVNQAGAYYVQISGSNCTAQSVPVNVSVVAPQTPSVILSTPGFTGSAGTLFGFTAVPTNGGTAPIYSFRVNGNQVQNGLSNTYSTTNLIAGDVVSCVLTSNAGCLTTTTATSNSFTIGILPNVSIAGWVKHPTKGTIPSVTVRLTGGSNDSVTTNNSSFSASVAAQRSYTLVPAKFNDVVKANGVNVLDVLAIQSHILNRTLLSSPYRIIAADANSDNAVNILDIIAVKRLILGIDATFAGNKLWSFVDSAFVFTNANNPFPYNSTKNLGTVTANSSEHNFYGVKLGDVNFDWNAVVGQNRTTAQPLTLYADTLYATQGDVVRVAFKVKNFNQLAGTQFAIKFDQQVFDYMAIENKLLAIDQNTQHSTQGEIRFVWADNAAIAKTLADGTTLFELVLRKKVSSSISHISIVENAMPALAFNRLGDAAGVQISHAAIMENRPAFVNILMEQLELSPNPSRGFLKVSIVSKEAKTISLIAQHISGTKVLEQVVKLDKGVNTIQVNLQARQAIADGLYYIHAVGLEGVKTKTVMILH